MANTDMRRKLAMMLDSYTVTASGIPPLSTYKRRLLSLKAFGGTEQRNLPDGYKQIQYTYMTAGSYIKVEDLLISADYRVEYEFQTTTLGSTLRNYIGGRAPGISAGGGFRLSKLASGGTTLNRVVLYGFEDGTEYYDPTTRFQPNTRYKYTYNNGVCTLESGGNVISTQTFTVTDNTSTKWGINSYVSNNNYWQTDTDGIYAYSLKVWNPQNELVMDLVPAIQTGTVSVVGFYDTASDTFRTATAGTFTAGPEAPTPDVPVDIISNNGVLKTRHQSGLPLDYIQVNGITGNGNSISLNTTLTQDDEIELVFSYSTSDLTNQQIFGSRSSANGLNISVFFSETANRLVVDFNNSNYTNYRLFADLTPNTIYKVLLSKNRRAVYQGDTLISENTTVCNDTITITNPLLYYVGDSPAYNMLFEGTVYSLKINGKIDLTSCTHSTDVGFYDKVSDSMFTLTGGISGNLVNDPVVCYGDGTVETIEVIGHNLLDLDNCTDGYYYSATGEYSEGSSARLSNFVKVKANETYTVFAYGLIGTANVRVNLFDTQKNWLSQVVIVSRANQYSAITVTAVQDGYLAFSGNYVTTGSCIDWDISQIVKGSYTVETMPEYEPYFNGGTATAEMLLKVGDYKDEQEILSGSITRNVGVKVLDGTENWSLGTVFILDNAVQRVVFPSTSMSTHFVGNESSTSPSMLRNNSFKVGANGYRNRIYIKATQYADETEFKAFLAQQYANGTPVIIVYPLETSTTESVAGQSMTFTKGLNTVDITQASLDNLELEIKAR